MKKAPKVETVVVKNLEFVIAKMAGMDTNVSLVSSLKHGVTYWHARCISI